MNNLNYIGASVFIVDLGKIYIFRMLILINLYSDSHANPQLYYNNDSNKIENFLKKSFKLENKDDKKKRRESVPIAKRPISISNSNSQLPPIK